MTEQESFVQNVIYWHPHHPHQPTDVNALHRATLKGINEQVAVFLTRTVGSMWMAYAFVLIAIIGLFSILGVLSPTIALLVAWASQTFIQLVLLPVIMVGQNVLSRHAELQSDETFATTQKSFADIEHIIEHLSAQDTELLKQTQMLQTALDQIAQRCDAQDQTLSEILTRLPGTRRGNRA